RQRPVEAEVAAKALDVLAGGLRPQHDRRGVAGGEVEDAEDEDGDAEQDGQREEEAPRDVRVKPGAPAPRRHPAGYCSVTGVSTRSKFGWSLTPWTRFLYTITCLPWSPKIHGASSVTSRCASLYSGIRSLSSMVVRPLRRRSSTRGFW